VVSDEKSIIADHYHLFTCSPLHPSQAGHIPLAADFYYQLGDLLRYLCEVFIGFRLIEFHIPLSGFVESYRRGRGIRAYTKTLNQAEDASL
jgi:hypothetical protein